MDQRVLTHCVFVGISPELETAPAFGAHQRRLRTEFGVRGPMTPFDRLHLSLVGLGDSIHAPGRRWIEEVGDILSNVRMSPFKIAFNTLVTFHIAKRVRPAVLTGEDGVIGVSMLRNAISAAFRAEGVGHGAAATPHVTLAWSEIVVPEHYVAPVTWTVREFVLIDSFRGAGQHEVLGRWSLQRP